MVSGDNLYIGTMEGDVRALDLKSGDTVWKFALRGEPEGNRVIYGTPAIANSTLFIGGYEGYLYALSLDGEDVWETMVGDGAPIVGSPVVADDTVLVGSSDGCLYAFDTADGSQRWKFQTEDKVWSTPAAAEGVAYFGSLDHNVYAVRVADGSQVWKFPTEGAVTAKLVVARGRVYVGSFGRSFYAIDAETGTEVWRFNGSRKWYWGGAVATESAILAPCLDGNLYALDIETGELKWTLETQGPIIGSPAVLSNWIAVASLDGKVRLVRPQDGGDENVCNIGVQLKNSLVTHEDVIYLAGDDHTIRALRVKTNGNPDEEWVHFTNQDDPVPVDWVRSC